MAATLAKPTDPAWRPCGSHLLICFTRHQEETQSGLLLPEIARRLPVSGIVLATGPGRDIAGTGRRTTIWSSVGDEILFQRADLREVDGYPEHALLLAEDVLAWVDSSGSVHPENDWVLVELAEREATSAGGISLPERARARARKGTFLEAGPGRLVLKGPFFGTRRPVTRIMGREESDISRRMVVHWSGSEPVIHLSRPKGHVLVKAGDLMLIEEGDNR